MKLTSIISSCMLILVTGITSAQEAFQSFQFESINSVPVTDVKSQGNTGTCWSFSCTSFLESEMIRQGKEAVDLSEMYTTRQTYLDKAERYLRFQGKTNFSQGGLGHDVINVLREDGAVPEIVFDGKLDPEAVHNHSALEKDLKRYLDSLLKNRKNMPTDWRVGANEILDTHLGAVPQEFEYEGKMYTPETFAEEVVELDANEYVSFTSFSHQPYYQPFVLEVPDNYSHGLFYNLPIAELTEVAKYALQNGFSIEWDGDVSEKGFNPRKGMAIVPAVDWAEVSDENKKQLFSSPIDEKEITQAVRQEAFDTYQLTDDHLMHITALVQDKDKKSYFLVKNSWGEIGPAKGYLYMSEAYFKLGTVSILIHKDAIPAGILEKLR